MLLLPMLASCGGGGNHSDTSSSKPEGNTPSTANPVPTAPDTSTSPPEHNTATIQPLQWQPPGGSATVPLHATAPFMRFAPSIDAARLVGVSQGRELFVAHWQAAPGPRTLLDGLGPLFNANACAACHIADGRVPTHLEDGNTTEAILFRLGNAAGETHPVLGGQLQHQATEDDAEGMVHWQPRADGALEYHVTLTNPALSMQGYHLGPRISPQLIGMGLLDSIPEQQILEYADPDDANGDGISGRPHWLQVDSERHLGRFGWKAIHATLRAQSAGAMHQDMGLTTPVHPEENCTAAQTICTTVPNGGTPEVSAASLQAITDFLTVLAVPERRINDQPLFDRGAQLFDRIGCSACHRPTFTTGSHPVFPELSNQQIYPYTDLLLHDMGDGLADGVRELDANANEWRTPPLWGIGIVEQKEGARFLHDGRARTLPEAITWHGGEAQNARDRFITLSADEQAAVLQFLRSI